MSKERISLKDYILAKEIVRKYESQIEIPQGNGGVIAECDKCGLKFPYTVTALTKQVNQGGTSIYFTDCPYCGEITEVTRV